MLSLEGFPGGLAGKESACDAGDLSLIPGLGRSPGVSGYGYPLQYSGLETSILYSSWGRKESDMTECLSLQCVVPVNFSRVKTPSRALWL